MVAATATPETGISQPIDPELLAGVNVSGGIVTNEAVATFLDVDHMPPLEALGIEG